MSSEHCGTWPRSQPNRLSVVPDLTSTRSISLPMSPSTVTSPPSTSSSLTTRPSLYVNWTCEMSLLERATKSLQESLNEPVMVAALFPGAARAATEQMDVASSTTTNPPSAVHRAFNGEPNPPSP